MKPYDSSILPNFLYCSIVWHFGSKCSALKVGKVNKRALWVVLNDYVSSYHESLLKTRPSSLYVSRIKTIASEMYKCKNDINPAFVGEWFTSHDPPYSLRNGENFEQPIVKTESFGLDTFRVRVPKYGMNCQIISKALMIWLSLKGRFANGLDHHVAVKTVFYVACRSCNCVFSSILVHMS